MANGQNDTTVQTTTPMHTTRNDHQRAPGHLRRSPPAEAVSIPHSKRRKLSHVPQDVLNDKERSTATHLRPMNSDSTGSDQSASKWFDKANENVPGSAAESRNVDDEPPFFLGYQNMPYLPTFVSHSTVFGGENTRADSEKDDLRGVIDDLTVENKRLKQILKSQHSKSEASPSQDKLFEIRMHGLSAEKKHELENLLKNFAVRLQTPTGSRTSSSGDPLSGLVHHNEVSTSNIKNKSGSVQNNDSGYGSQSNSAANSSTPVGGSRSRLSIPGTTRDKNIKSYLHDIPDTLLPRKPMVMSERLKMIMVVQRLEQLFTGRKASPGMHAQPMQQQEVSNSAARADRVEDAKNNRKRKAEGTREAHILPFNSKVNLEGFDMQDNASPDKSMPLAGGAQDITPPLNSHPGSPDQRPTRPLDLDIHRAQVAAENLQYIHHLGLLAPEQGGDAMQSSYIFLNLLMSMAQLHTINVTPDFVRRAVKKLSTTLEISKDGKKIRWKGGIEGTKFSKDDERAVEVESNTAIDSNCDTNGESGRGSHARSKSNAVISDNTSSEEKLSGNQISDSSKPPVTMVSTSSNPMFTSERPKSASTFDYKPIVFTGKRRHVVSELSYLDCSSSQGSLSGDSNGLVHALSRSNLNRSQNPDEGTITFYNNPSFYSDLTGDRTPMNLKPNRNHQAIDLLGLHGETELVESPLRHHDACYFTPQFANPPYQPSHAKDLAGFDFMAIESSGEPETVPIELPVCGVGFVTPADNFAVDVKTARRNVAGKKTITRAPTSRFGFRGQTNRYEYQTEAATRIQLQTPKLPPPNYVLFTSSSSSGQVGGDDDSDLSESDTSSVAEEAIPAFIKMMTAASSGLRDADMDNDEDNDESSIDMLQIARAMDPAGIAAQEREYVINQPGGVNAVAGSLAATVGASRSSPSASSGYESVDLQEDGSSMDVDD